MKISLLKMLIGFLMITGTASAQQKNNADNILGVWLSEAKDGKVEIYTAGNKYFGKLIWGKDMFEADGKTSKKDVKNTERKLRTRDMKNLIILSDFAYADGVYEDGEIYDPQSGKTYSCSMRIEDKILNIRGYVGLYLFGRTSIWTKLN